MSKFIHQITQEECGEVIQAISKCLRFGLFQTNPNTGVSNKDHLAEELGQLSFMIETLLVKWDLNYNIYLDAWEKKPETLKQYSEYEV